MAKSLRRNDAASHPAQTAIAKESGDSQAAGEAVQAPIALATSKFPVVGIVASAGGLDGFNRFFSKLPSPCGVALVLVPHLDANRRSQMVELIARQTSLLVCEAADGMQIAVDTVYIIPPNRFLSLSRGRLQLNNLPDPLGSQTAIDSFLRSLAVDQEERAIGIVLSGTGSHGSLGLREIKRCGGMTMVQSPETAEFDQMPRSAIETGIVDFVLPPSAMPEALLRYIRSPYLNRPQSNDSLSGHAAEQLRVVLDLVRIQTKCDFRHYRKNMLMRRVERRIGIAQLPDLPTYIETLKTEPGELNALSEDFLIGVTTFFREAEAFTFLETELFSELVAEHPDAMPLRAWVPGCATGEEAYSIAILLLEAFTKAGKTANIQIFASDINQQSINVARRGVYPDSIANDVSQDRLKKFFKTFDTTHYQVGKQLRDAIVFSKQNVIGDSPFSKLDLICCRNLMIYLEPEVQQKLISLFHYALNENGSLFLGPAETIGRATELFEPISKKWRVYRRVGPAVQVSASLPVTEVDSLPRSRVLLPQASGTRKEYKELMEGTLRDYAPAAVLINQRYEVLYVSGAMANYIEFPTGELSKDLLAMARAGLRTRIRSACSRALSQRVTVVDQDARVQRNSDYIPCKITVRPLLDSSLSDPLLFVMLQDRLIQAGMDGHMDPNTGAAAGDDVGHEGPVLVQLLEYELKSTREELQNTIEEMESSNEELQSSNEELESSKEELQSLNEELSTVNFQLLEKVGELDKSNSEFANLMASTEIAMLYLDDQLCIKRFTQPTAKLFGLVSADEGRDISGMGSTIMGHDLLNECHHVLQSGELVEKEILASDHRCFLRRILPFRIADHSADGIVVSYVELTAIKQAEADQRERDACFREVFEHAATGIAIATLDGRFENCNPAYCKLLGYTEAELHGVHILTHVCPDDQEVNREVLRTLQVNEISSYEIENRYVHKDGSIVWVRKLESTLLDGSGKPSRIMALVTNVTVQRQSIQALKLSEERTRAILKTASDAIITITNAGIIDSANQATESIFGYTSDELVGKNVSMLMPQPFRQEHDGFIQRFLDTHEARIIGTGREVLCQRKDGSTFPADLAVSQVDHLGFFTGVLRDISSRKEMQKHILEIAADEQRRIGLELHDGTQQELTGLSLYANALLETMQNATLEGSGEGSNWRFEAADFERLQRTAGLLSKRLAETNQHVRDLAHGILPVQIDAGGLQSALTELARSINLSAKARCTFECTDEFTVPDNTMATHLYRIAQEAVNNALRHGSAEHIQILLTLRDDLIVLDISDDGVGFNNEVTKSGGLAHKGMGMRTMEYRASLVGGRVQAQRGLEGGTLIRCEISMRGR